MAYYQLTYRTTFVLNVEYGYFNFKEPQSLRDSRSLAALGGFEFSPIGVFSGKMNLGYKYFDALKAGVKDYRGVVGDTEMSIRLMKPLSVRANYKRGVEFSVWYDNAYYIENRAGAGASIYLFRNIRLDYDYFRGRNNYPQSQLIAPGSFGKRRDDYEIQTVGIYFRLKKNVGLGVTANQWIRDSNLVYENGKRIFIGANLTYNF